MLRWWRQIWLVLRRGWETLSHVDTGISLAGWSWSGIWTLGMSLWAIIENQTPVIVAVVAIAVFTCTFLMALGAIGLMHKGKVKDGRTVSAVLRDWSLRDGLLWWEKVTGKKKEQDGLEFFHRIRQEHSDGNLPIWGRANYAHMPVKYYEHTPLVQIPPEHSRNCDFDSTRYIYVDQEDDIRATAWPPSGADRYVDLRVSSAEIRKLWPEGNS